MRLAINISLLALILSALLSCGTTKTVVSSRVPEVKTPSKVDNSLRVKVERTFMDAQRAKVLGNIEEAKKLFEQVVRLDPVNGAAKYELALIYYHGNMVSTALDNARDAAKADPSNKWYQMLYADLLATNEEFKEAAKVYEGLIANDPDQYDLYFDWAQMLIEADKIQEAINVYDELEKRVGMDDNIVFQKQRLYLKMNDLPAAASEIQRLIDQNPTDPGYYGVLAEMYEANGENDKAIESYEKLLKIDPDNPYALLAIADLNNRMGNKEGFFDNIKKAFADPDLDIDVKVRVLYPYIERFGERQEHKNEAFELAEILVQAHPDDAKAFAIQGDLYNLDEQYEKALQSFKKSLEITNDIYTVWQQVLLIQSDLKDYDNLIADSKKAIELFPNQPLNYLMKGIGHQQKKDYEPALKAFDRGGKMAVDNPRLKAQFLSNLGDIYHELNDNKKSDSCYEESIKYDPENPFVLNNYSYYLSLRDQKLDRAKDMSLKSNEMVPDNSAFQDTYAWILYKLGKYKEARTWQVKALQLDGESPTLLEHYGDILYQIGEINKAVEYWQKAMEKGSDSAILGKKIADRKLYED